MKVLLLEDDSVDAHEVIRGLRNRTTVYHVEVVCTLGAALKRVAESNYDIILSDLSLPDSFGLEPIQKLQAAVPKVPIVVLTGLEDQEMSLRAISEGAQDYLVKGTIQSSLIERSIQHAVQRHELVRQNGELLESLRESRDLILTKNRNLERVCQTAQQFVDNVSHEFRTPLTVIMEYAALLADGIAGDVNDEQRNMLEIIDDRAGDLDHMVDDMLDVSKLQSGLLNAARTRCQIRDIIDHVLPSVQRKAALRDVKVEVHVPDDLPDAYCDPEKAGRVILNLATNAIKFSGRPGRVEIFAEAVDETELRVRVCDNGIGIPKDRQQDIFQRFSQVKTELRESTKGFGLGLNIAKELVDLNLGGMGVESEEGQGSTFSFTVPADRPMEISRRFIRMLKGNPDVYSVSAIRFSMVGDDCENMAGEMELFVTGVLRQNDLVLPLNGREWLLLVSVPSIELETFLQRFQQQYEAINRNRPRGPLPGYELNTEATWNIQTDVEEIVRCIALSYSGDESTKGKKGSPASGLVGTPPVSARATGSCHAP